LFVYGSLREPMILKSVCGYSFTLDRQQAADDVLYAEPAILDGYKKASPDNVYYYAIPDESAKIEGLIIYNLPEEAVKEIDKYEGKLYLREIIQVNTASGLVYATAYLACTPLLRKHFGDRFHVNLIHELWLRKRIEKFFDTHTRPGEKSADAEIERKARRELLGTTERDLVVSHLGSDAVSDFYLAHELNRPVPSLRHLDVQEAARPYIKNYILLVIRQVLLNQFEQLIYTRFRYEIQRMNSSKRFYTRTISLLAALKMLNAARESVELILQKCIETMPFGKAFDLLDYVKYAVHAAESIFDVRMARSQLEKIRSASQPGLVPLGAELEFSNLGYNAVDKSCKIVDRQFDGFRYFNDFCLNILMWKLGGYIDDHSGSTDTPGRCGFLEFAPGRLNIAGEISKPATSDPWILNQLIREITFFYPIQPHSLHLSFQLRKKQLQSQQMLTLGFVKCLLALGGDPRVKNTGKLWVSRMAHDEIRQHQFGDELVFARTSKRRYYLRGNDWQDKFTQFNPSYVQQYKFIRLDMRANYEPLIMALKGLQIAYNPADYLTAKQLASSAKLRREYVQLQKWAENPTPISYRTINQFLDTIAEGLCCEAHHRPAHSRHYIDWAMSAIDVQLRLFNKAAKEGQLSRRNRKTAAS